MGFNIPAGKLKHVISIQERSDSVDSEYGGTVQDWSVFATGVRVEKTPMTGREKIAKQAAVSEEIIRYRMRFISGVNATMRIVDGDVEREIIGPPVDINGAGQWLEILTQTVVSGA